MHIEIFSLHLRWRVASVASSFGALFSSNAHPFPIGGCQWSLHFFLRGFLSSHLLFDDEPPPRVASSPEEKELSLRLAFAQLFHANTALDIALDGASRCWSLGLMHAECSRRWPTCAGNDRGGLPASRLQLQRSSRVRCTRTPSTLCMHDSARMTQPARRTRSTTLTRLHVGASHLRADT